MFKKFLTLSVMTSFVAFGVAQLSFASPYPPSCQYTCDQNYLRCLISSTPQATCQAKYTSCLEYCGVM